MAVITTTVEKKTRINIRLSRADILKLFLDAHPELAGETAEAYLTTDIGHIELQSHTYNSMDDIGVTIITEKTEING